MLKIIKALYLLINVLIIIGLLLIHFVFKESSYTSSLNFYAFQLPIIIFIVLLLSIFLKKKIRKFNFVLASALLLIWLSRSFKIHITDDIKETDLEIVFWNASRNNGFKEAFIENNEVPDILVLVESKKNNLHELQLKYPNYYFYEMQREMYIFSKNKVEINKTEISKYNTTVLNFKAQGVNFYAIDVTGSTDVPRSWELGFVDEIIKLTKNTIVLGDFNVPFESKYLEKFKSNFNHAFNKKGNGFRETWFWNIPLLSLDHIWVSKDLKVLKTEKINTFKSDHSMIKTYVRK